jgi:anthranilate phosphoribosyltransferase
MPLRCARSIALPAASASGRTGSPSSIIRQVLQGEVGPKRDIVLMNAAAALLVGGKARDFKDGVALASRSIDSGAALAKLLALSEFGQRLSAEK